MNKFILIGVLLLIGGVILYFTAPEEPISTIAGVISGIGFAVLLVGVGVFRKNSH